MDEFKRSRKAGEFSAEENKTSPLRIDEPQFENLLKTFNYSQGAIDALSADYRKEQIFWLNAFYTRYYRLPNYQEYLAGKNGRFDTYQSEDELQTVSKENSSKTGEREKLFHSGCVAAGLSTVLTLLVTIVNSSLIGSFSNAIASSLASNYQSSINDSLSSVEGLSFLFLIVSISWMWFAVYQLKKEHYKGWSIYFLVVSLIGIIEAIVTIGQCSNFLSYLGQSTGGDYASFLSWSIFSSVLTIGVNVLWIRVFVKSRK